MGYTLELHAVDLHGLIAELRNPTIDPTTIRDAAGLVAELTMHWDTLASTISRALAPDLTGDARGGELGGELANYVLAVVRARGHNYGSLWHTSAGGTEFRTEFLPGPVAARFGRTFVANLVNRALDDLTWADHPMVGYATHAELEAVLDTLKDSEEIDANGIDENEIDEDIHTLEAAIGRAHQMGLDLAGVYC